MWIVHKPGCKPTDTAPILWLVVMAILIGWVVVIVVGRPVVLTP